MINQERGDWTNTDMNMREAQAVRQKLEATLAGVAGGLSGCDAGPSDIHGGQKLLRPSVRWPIAILSCAGVPFFTGLMFLAMIENHTSRMAYPGLALACGMAALALGASAVYLIQGGWAGRLRRWALILASVMLAQAALVWFIEAGDAKGTGWYVVVGVALGGLAAAAFRWAFALDRAADPRNRPGDQVR